MSSIYDWSTTAANNGTADSDTPWPEGMARRQVNDSARNMMKRNAELLGDIGGALSAGGTADGLTVTANSAFTTYADGQIISFRATADNTGAATLSVNGIGAKAIRKMDSTGDVALAAGDIQATGLYMAQYSAALNGAAGAWLLVNPTLSAAIYALSSLVTVDNTVPRFNGIAGALQTSGVIIDDSNNVTGVGTLTATGVITTGGDVIGSGSALGIRPNTSDGADTKATFLQGGGAASETRGGLVLVYGNEHGTNPGQVRLVPGSAASAIKAESNVQVTGSIFRDVNNSSLVIDGGSAVGNGAHVTLNGGAHASPNQAFYDADVHTFRLQSAGSGTSVLINGTLAASGNIDTSGHFIAASGGVFRGSTTQVVIGSHSASGDAATIFFRVDGYNSTTGQTSIDPSGNMVVSGDITAGDAVAAVNFSASTGGFHTNGKTASNPATVGASIISSGQGNFTVSNDTCQISNRTGSDGTIYQFRKDNTTVGTIAVTGSATSYNTSSDYRLKDNIRDLEGSGAFIDALRPRTFEMKATGETVSGFIAHEFAEVSPISVTGEKDGAEYQAMQASTAEVMANVVKELQTLRARVAALEA